MSPNVEILTPARHDDLTTRGAAARSDKAFMVPSPFLRGAVGISGKRKAARTPITTRDWTWDAKGRSNSSPALLAVCTERRGVNDSERPPPQVHKYKRD